jgi:hypothetical protein
VFSGGDIVKQLPQEAKRFQNIDKNYMKIVTNALETLNVVKTCYGNELMKTMLPHLLEQLELCQKVCAHVICLICLICGWWLTSGKGCHYHRVSFAFMCLSQSPAACLFAYAPPNTLLAQLLNNAIHLCPWSCSTVAVRIP